MNFKYFKNESLYSDLNYQKAYNDLSEIIKCKTISYINQDEMDINEFKKLHNILNKNFPLVFKNSKVEIINEASILYYIEGSDKTLDPILLMAHIDVVPDNKEDDNKWDFDAFSGEITEEYIYGRGSEDIKCLVILYLTAIEYLLSHNKKFKRGIYLAFGHDEETLGGKGQLQIKNLLQSRNVKLEMVLDEGGGIESGSTYKTNNPLAVINVMEKGYLDVKIKATKQGGHSSNPGKYTSLGLVSKAIYQLEENQFKPYLNTVFKESLTILKDDISCDILKKYASNITKYEKELIEYCLNDKHLAPFVYTTTAPTMIEGGSMGANVLPKTVEAVINFRLLDCDNVDYVMDHIRKTITDENIVINKLNSIDASKISNINSYSYEVLKNTINKFFDNIKVIPGMVCGGTDCRFYNDISDNCYRFSPIFNDFNKCNNFHNVNERCQKRAFIHGVKFIISLVENMCL